MRGTENVHVFQFVRRQVLRVVLLFAFDERFL